MLYNFFLNLINNLKWVGVSLYTNLLMMFIFFKFLLLSFVLNLYKINLHIFYKIYFILLNIIKICRLSFLSSLGLINLSNVFRFRKTLRLGVYIKSWIFQLKEWFRIKELKSSKKDSLRYNLFIFKSYLNRLKISNYTSIFFDRSYRRSVYINKFISIFKRIVNLKSYISKPRKIALSLSNSLVTKLLAVYLHLDNDKLNKKLTNSNRKAGFLESNPLYASNYFPYTFNIQDERKGIFMSMNYTVELDVLPYGDLLDFDMYYEFNNELPFPYAEAGWDLSLASKHLLFKYWLRWYGWLGVRYKPTQSMTHFTITDLHMQCRKLQDKILDKEGMFFVFHDNEQLIDEANSIIKYKNYPDVGLKANLLIKGQKALFSLFNEKEFSRFNYWNSYNGDNLRLVRYWNQDSLIWTIVIGFFVAICVLFYSYYYLSFYMSHIHYADVFSLYPYRTSYNKANVVNYYKVRTTYWPFLYASQPYLVSSPYEWLLFKYSFINNLFNSSISYHASGEPMLFREFTRSITPRLWILSLQNYYATFGAIDSTNVVEDILALSYIEHLYNVSEFMFISGILMFVNFKLYILLIVVISLTFLLLGLAFFKFSSFSKFGQFYYLILNNIYSSITVTLNHFVKQSKYRTQPFNRLINKLRVKNASSQTLFFRYAPLNKDSELYMNTWFYPAIVDFSTFKYQFRSYYYNFPFINEFNLLNNESYSSWSNWYDADLDRRFSENSIYFTEEGDEEYDEMDDIGTDNCWRFEYYAQDAVYLSTSSLYSPYFSKLEWYYFKSLAYPKFCSEDDFIVKNDKYSDRLDHVLSFVNNVNYISYIRNDPLLFSRFFYAYDKQFTWHNPVIDKEREYSFSLMRKNTKLQHYDNYKLFFLNKAVSSYFYFPTDRWIETEELLINFTNNEFYKRVFFSKSFLKMRYYKLWHFLNHYKENSKIKYLYMLKTSRIKTINDVRDDFVLSTPAQLADNFFEVEEFFDDDVDTYLSSTLTYEFRSSSFLDRDMDSYLINWYENQVSIKAGYFTNHRLYVSAFGWYFKDEVFQNDEEIGIKSSLRISLNDLYWSENQVTTWLPVVINDSAISSQYLRFNDAVLLFAYLFNQFEEYKLNSATNSDDMLLPDVFTFTHTNYRRYFPGHGQYFDKNQLKYVGAWPYGLDIMDMEDGLMIKRITSLDSGSNPSLELDEQNYSRELVVDLPGLTFEQRLHLLIDHRKRTFMRYYDIIDIMFIQNGDIEVNDDYFLGKLWLGQHVVWFTSPDSYSGYDSWF